MNPVELEREVAEYFKKEPKTFLALREKFDKYLVDIKCTPAATPDKPYPVSLQPLFLSRQSVETIFDKLKIILGALVKARAEYFKNSEMQNYIGLPEIEADIISNDTQMDIVGNIRADVFLQQDGGIKIVEYNSDYPDAIFIDTMCVEWFREIPHITNIQGVHLPASLSELFKKAMLRSFRMNRGDDKPVIGLFAPMERVWLGEFYAFDEGMKAAGFETYMLDPKRLEFTDGKLSHKGRKINLVRKATEMFYFRENRERLNPFFKSCRNGDFVMYNSFKDRLLGYKTFLAVLTDEKWAHLFTDNERKIIGECVPRTRRIRPNMDAGELKRQKEKLVLKPAGDAEGHGVVIGSTVSDKEWEHRVDEVFRLVDARHEWIEQEKVGISRRPVLQWNDGELHETEVHFDLMCHLFGMGNEIVDGPIYSRSSRSAIVNLAQGGALHPVFTVD